MSIFERKYSTPVIRIAECEGVELYLKREDLIHPLISGNKFWKLYHVLERLERHEKIDRLLTFGGAYSNHIATVAAVGNMYQIPTVGLIRGYLSEEQVTANPTLHFAKKNGMSMHFLQPELYRQKHTHSYRAQLMSQYPDALIIPEGGTEPAAVEGVRHMLADTSQDFDYLCCAVGTGGTLAGIAKYRKQHQKAIGFAVVRDHSLPPKITALAGHSDFSLVDASYGGYGKIKPEIISFINYFYEQYHIPLDPVYTGKMMHKLLQMIKNGYFQANAKILAIHTGGLQGVLGANVYLKMKNRKVITFAEEIQRSLTI